MKQKAQLCSELKREDDELHLHPFKVKVTVRFLIVSLLISILFAFTVGRLCSKVLLQIALASQPETITALKVTRALPPVFFKAGKTVPSTIYTSKNFDNGILAATSDSFFARRVHGTGGLELTNGNASMFEENENEGQDDEEQHDPAGQHLLVDIEHVDAVFLNSVERLATAMVKLIDISGLTMLSYHCHSMQPMGVSCIGVLLESHISLHTWPIPGVILLDLFTCGPEPILPLLPTIKELFAVPAESTNNVDQPNMVWSHKKRGFRPERGPPDDIELDQFTLGWMEYDMKNLVQSVNTGMQSLSIYDVINPRFRHLKNYERSLAKDMSYESQHPELFQPDRIIYIDDIMQSRRYGEAAYHEALVHPAMFTHSHPNRVAIIGGGEGATLREVLKHKTVKKVRMIEIDEVMVNVSRTYLPEWSDCSSIVGSTLSCFDDPRAELLYTDAFAWFIDNFANEGVDETDKFDVIIMDLRKYEGAISESLPLKKSWPPPSTNATSVVAVDTGSAVEYSNILHDSGDFIKAIRNALSKDGIVVAQIGEEYRVSDASEEFTNKKHEAALVKQLFDNGFEEVKDYSEVHAGNFRLWRFLIALSSERSKAKWYANEAEVNLEMLRRGMLTKRGDSPFRHFDGATMVSIQFPSRVVEEVHCRSRPLTELCALGHGFDSERQNIPASLLETKGKGTRAGVFAKTDIPAGSYVAADDSVYSILFNPATSSLIKGMSRLGVTDLWKAFDHLMLEFGMVTNFFGEASFLVDADSILAFINHDVFNDTNARRLPFSITDIKAATRQLLNLNETQRAYSPVIDRNFMRHLEGSHVANHNTKAGEEIFGA